MGTDTIFCNYKNHNFKTDDIKKLDQHFAEYEHEYDLKIKCASCTKKIHIKPVIKLNPNSRRIPRGFVCNECKDKIKNTKEVKAK